MKKLLYFFLFFLFFIRAEAQQVLPPVKEGTEFNYKFFLYGQTAAINLSVKSLTDSVLLNWNMKGGAYGSYLISKTGFENGTKINFIQPAYQTVLKLAPDETFAIISKSAFRTLKKDKKFVYNNTTYALKADHQENPFKIGDQEMRVLHVVGVEEMGELWILDNPDFPLICQFKNNPAGINFTLVGIK